MFPFFVSILNQWREEGEEEMRRNSDGGLGQTTTPPHIGSNLLSHHSPVTGNLISNLIPVYNYSNKPNNRHV